MDPARILRETWSGLLDIVYPPKCLVCGDLGPNLLCPTCMSAFSPLAEPICSRCGKPVEGRGCWGCHTGLPANLKRIRSAAQFQGTLREAILRLKYGGKRRLGDPLGRFLGEFLTQGAFASVQFDALIPVPLHRSRIREREYNQAALIAEPLAKMLDTPLNEGALTRTRRTKSQVDLLASERVRNVYGAFSVSDLESVRGLTLLMIDDVITTGATVDECARALLEAGAKEVYAASLAREI